MSKKILVVDDADDIRKVVLFVLQKEGYDVLEAPDGEKALQCIREQKPDLVFLDMHLPIVDGPQVYREVQEDEELKKIPIVFLTGSDQDLIEEKMESLEIGDVIKKPFTSDELKAKVEHYLGS